MAASPKPVITCFGETHLLTNVVLKKLQSRLKSLQLSGLSKEDLSQGFSDVCDGMNFVDLQKTPEPRGQYPRPRHDQPALHTFWTECWNSDSYQTHTRPLIQQWLQMVEGGAGGGAGVECAIVYCITPEVRAKRQRTFSNFPSHVMEDMRNDFKQRELLLLRLASSEESRVLDSLQTFCGRLTSLCRSKFQRDIEQEVESVAKQRSKAYKPEDLYGIFRQKLNLAVSYEMILQNEEALKLYQEAAADLEEAITMHYHSETPPTWLQMVREAPCESWDYPKLVWHHLSWRYLPLIQEGRSPLLHTHTFLLTRLSHLHFCLERAWTVSDLAIATLHAMARQMRTLQLSLPDGAFDCWAYMACHEVVLAIMSRVNPDSLVDSTTSLLLVRAELWDYALEKLHFIGGLCGLMPSSNTLNRDNILIRKLTNGITPVPFEVSSKEIMEDQGINLRRLLTSKDSFKEAYLMLGEMVIGAFKHAGRRRMAFRVGTKIARFHRDLGMLPEAEDLLSDICRFYSEDQWLELSAPSYALLADCQRQLELEDQHVNTLVLLSSLPAYPSAAHDPAYWMDQLMTVANKSPYQKILTWSPLLELVKVRVGGGGKGEEGREGGCVKVRETMSLQVVLKSHAPKLMKNVIVVLTLVTKPAVSTEQRMSSSLEPTSPLISTPSSPLEDLDLNLEIMRRPRSRPIGHITKARTNTTTLISSSSIVEMEGRGQRKVKLLLSTILPTLPPGQSTITITGKIQQPGEYFPEKVSVKCGSLDFVISEPSPQGWWLQPLIATAKTEELSISLLPNLGIFLASYPQECTLTFETGADGEIPQGSPVSLVISSDVTISCPGGTVSQGPGEGEQTVAVSLPAVVHSSHHSLPLHLTFPSLSSRCPSLPSSPSYSSSAQKQDKESGAERHTRQFPLEVRCERQGQVMEARLSVPVCQPLTISHSEHSAGESTFLQLLLENTCPAPLLLRSPALSAADISTTQLHTALPQALPPGGNFSCIWQTQPGLRAIGDRGKATFRLQYKPLIADQETWYVDLSYAFPISNMQTVFHSQLFTEGLKEARVAILKYVVHNMATSLPLSQLPEHLHYSITDTSGQWKIQDSQNGALKTPTSGKSEQICIQAVPSKSGTLIPPRMTLSVPRVGSKVETLDSSVIEMVTLTPAQVYELSLGETITVG